MKRAYIQYIANGFTLMASVDTVRPPPVWVFATNIDEVIFYLNQYFTGEPEDTRPPGQQPLIFTPIDAAAESADPLMNQEAQVWPLNPTGYMVRQSEQSSAPGRPVLDVYCPTMDDVHAHLTAIFTAAL